MSDVLKQVQVTNGGGPRFTIPLGAVVLALAAAQVWSQVQMWETQEQVKNNSTSIAALVDLEKRDAVRVEVVEDAVLELKAQRDAERQMRGDLIREWRNLGEAMKEQVK